MTPALYALSIGGAFFCGYCVCYVWHGVLWQRRANERAILYRELTRNIKDITSPR